MVGVGTIGVLLGHGVQAFGAPQAGEAVSGAGNLARVPVDYDGNRLPDVPKWNFSVMATYEARVSANLAASFSLDYAYKGAFFADAKNDPDLNVDSYGLLGGRMGLASDDSWEMYLWAENLLDKDYLINKVRGNNLRGTWGMPRSYGVQLNYKF